LKNTLSENAPVVYTMTSMLCSSAAQHSVLWMCSKQLFGPISVCKWIRGVESESGF